MSFLWNAPLEATFLPAMAQAISLGICAALEPHVPPSIKWPNDVRVGDRKIGGILCERVPGSTGDSVVVVAGIGLNVNLGEESAEGIDQPVTSMALETGTLFDTDAVLSRLLESLMPPLNLWASRGFPGIREAYQRRGVPLGTAIRVRDGAQHTEGVLLGYTDQGALKLRVNGGEERIFYSGDISDGAG